MRTLAQAITTYGVDVDPHLERAMTIPVARFVRQGDVIVIPADITLDRATGRDVPQGGIPVVRGEAGGNTHLLLAEGVVRWYAATRTSEMDLDLGTLAVAGGAVAYLAHPEHGYAGIAPGIYTVRRQREQADEIRMVAD